ncbi:uncharacterized protein BDW70DRAFT_127075 [Aspergillus foveolatus]|uniref:uncharacterized protein n=1 Tax=Aspergillus foveolatus TaxID=210207 RepID=UPI003CCD3B3E
MSQSTLTALLSDLQLWLPRTFSASVRGSDTHLSLQPASLTDCLCQVCSVLLFPTFQFRGQLASSTSSSMRMQRRSSYCCTVRTDETR